MAVRNVPYHANFVGGFSGHNNPGGRVFYVAPSGYTAVDGIGPSDSNSGTSPQQPFATIQKGIDSCVDGRGDTVALLPGVYTITSALTFANGTDDNITLTAAHPGPADGRVEITTSTDSISMVEIDANFVTLQGLYFDHNTTTAAVPLIDVADGSSVVGVSIINCFVDMEGSATDTNGIRLGDGTNTARYCLLDEVTIHDYDQDGILVGAGSDENVIRNCNIYDGVSANSGQYGISNAGDGGLIDSVTVQTDGTAGIYGNGTLNRVINSKIWATGANTICVLHAASSTGTTIDCWLTAVAAGNLVDYTTDNTSPSADAFVSNVFAADAGITVMGESTVGGADA